VRSEDGAWSHFAADLQWSADACSRAPLVPFLWMASSLLPLLSDVGPLGVLLLPVFFFSVGFPGTVRLFFALERAQRPPLGFEEAFTATLRYFGRFACVGLGGGLLAVPFFLLAAAVAGDSRVLTALGTTPVVLVLDVVGTFIPPALALSTSRVLEAIPLGWRVLRDGWRSHCWHVLAPPLALQVVAATHVRSLGLAAQVAVLLPAGILGLLLRGATTAAYLRAVPLSDGGPSWLDGRPRQALAR